MTSIENAAGPGAWFKVDRDVFEAGGAWTIAESARLDQELRHLDTGSGQTPSGGAITMDASAIERLDSTGAWLLLRTRRALESAGRKVSALKVPDRYVSLLENLSREDKIPAERKRGPRMGAWQYRLYRIGKATMDAGRQGWNILGYLGRVTVETGEMIAAPRKNLRFAAMVNQVEETGISALPIVGLLSFLIGVVIAYQGITQLQKFGAELLTIDGLGIITLREMGVLMTSIIIAGRSGSAFTAQIGTMRVNQEIDAMQTMGLNTVDTLVLPRIVGLVIALPLLTLYADIMGLMGGAVMCYFDLHISIPAFMRELQQALSVKTLMVGMVKAPVFAFVIALVGCYEGFQVERNAASVGLLTTRSVVESVFLVIVLDAAFSIMFSVLGI
ncbi:MAG: MlaE family lipid ABC transporter permease subunit [Pseudomonadota bacterium]